LLKLYNTLGRKTQAFKPRREGEVKMYTCGPTVWNYAHIGNFRTFVFEDLLRRYLKFKGFKVTQVMNITDVEDKIIKGIRESGKSLQELTSFYEKAFFDDLATLGVERAEYYPRATEHIDDMVSLIKTLVSKGYAYRAGDGSVYYDVRKFKRYGALSGVRVGYLKTAGRVISDYYEDKKEAADFALWKAWDKDDGDVFWETDLGKGRPGWHIECSAMSMKYLGQSFDIHTGGVDHRFPHHENEIAQSEAATGKKFVNYWLHSEFLNFRGEDMHKSVGNVVYLSELLKEGWDPLTIRFFLISSKYRDPMNLDEAALSQADAQRRRMQEFASRLMSVSTGKDHSPGLADELKSSFEEAMDDDLNTPQALASMFTFIKKYNARIDEGSVGPRDAGEALEALASVNAVLGVLDFEKHELQPKLADLLSRRDDARKNRDFAEADRLRELLSAEGIEVEDTPQGTRWKKKRG
jgi:cysteinyl-tRNA synthetase